MSQRSVIRRGKDALPRVGESKFLKIPEGEAVVIVPLTGLDDLISVDQHAFWDITPGVLVPCTGGNCPACSLGNKPSFRAFLPVMTRENGAKIFSFGISVLTQLESLEEELGSLTGQVIKVRRRGSGLSTKYTVVAVGKKVSVKGVEAPDIITAIGPTDSYGVRRVLADAGLLDPDEPKTKRTSKVSAKTQAAQESEPESESAPETESEKDDEEESGWDDDAETDTSWDNV
jgi:hypothetical protein